MKHLSVLPCLSLCLVAGVQAASPPAGFQACSELSDPTQRLGCYDARMAEFKSQASAPPAVVAATPAPAPVPTPVPAPVPATAPPVVAAAPATPVTKFGADDLPLRTRPKVEADEVLQSRIADIRVAQSNVYVISLANGQVWRQSESGTQVVMFFRPGNDVRIEKGMLGDYRMSTTQTGAKNWVRVTRIR